MSETNHQQTHLWKAVKDHRDKELYLFLEPGGIDFEVCFERDKDDLDELYDAYKAFCRKAIAMYEHPLLFQIPGIQRDFECFTHRLNTVCNNGACVDGPEEFGEELDTSGYFLEVSEVTTQTEFVRSKITAMANELLVEAVDLSARYPNGARDDEIQKLKDKEAKLRALARSCTWNDKWIKEAQKIFSF